MKVSFWAQEPFKRVWSGRLDAIPRIGDQVELVSGCEFQKVTGVIWYLDELVQKGLTAELKERNAAE